MVSVAIMIILLSIVFILVVGIKGIGIFNRLLAANSIGTLVVALIVLMGQSANTAFFIDIALIYALVNFIATIGILRYVQYRQPTKHHEEQW